MQQRQATILVVDNDALIRNVIGAVLRRHQYRVFLAATAEETKALCLYQPIDLVLLERVLPNVVGWTLALAITRWLPQTALIIVSWMAWSSHPDAALPPGITTYLHKTVSPERLMIEVRAALGAPS